ncbi:peptide deformylase [Candidatus Gottesmanbacteria bacterium]|nr:peptide deformylase [Candidatus Gottesmanbacteria bacterium]
MIVKVPNPVLFQKAKPVGRIDKKIERIIKDLKTTLLAAKNPKGVGLAAPQIGISLNIFITRSRESNPIRVFINPEILWKSEELVEIQRETKTHHPKENLPALPAGRHGGRQEKLEGCLSIDNVWGHLKRPAKVRLRFMDQKGQIRQEEFSGFMATIVQHEADHLDGILFTKRVLEQKEKLYLIEKGEKGKETLIEIKI